jgi:hypothetical protein
MSIASLNRFTVPLASDSSATSQGMLMPKLKYRFRVLFENFGVSTPTTELTKQVQTAVKPNAQFANQVIDTYNSKINYAGKVTWSPMAITLRDDATGVISKMIGEQMQKQFDFYEQASAASGTDYKFTMKIEILDGGNGIWTPAILETWEMYGCYIVSANYQSLSYSEATPQMIDLSIQPDNCLQTPQGTGIGTNVGRTQRTMATGGAS